MAEAWVFLVVIFASLLGASGATLLKTGSSEFSLNISRLIRNRSLAAGIGLYIVASIIFVYALKHGELSILYPVISTSYIWAALFSVRFLNERMNRYKWLGILLIIIGVFTIGIA